PLLRAPDVGGGGAAGRFPVGAGPLVADGLALLPGAPFGAEGARAAGGGVAPPDEAFPPDSVLGRAAATLVAYRRACLRAGNPRAWRRRG
ncbi:MAG: hypothetical protein ACK4GB_02500, partial [Tepidimonas sp.]